MANSLQEVFHNVHQALVRGEKETLIRQSGSTAAGHHEKIRSGQSYLYKKYGMESEVIEIRFRQKVSGSFLNQALSQAICRYPYFNTRLIEKDGDFYIVQNPNAPVARRTQKLARLGHISCGYHLVDITYYDFSVYVAFHHALCDGRGIKPFVETLLYYYCQLRYKTAERPEGVRLAGEPLLEGETLDPFLRKYDFDASKDFISLFRDAYVLPESAAKAEKTNYRYEIMLPHDRFMAVCRENNATPVILLSLLMSRGIAALYPNYDKPINANIATDMRAALDAPNTFKNCVRSMILPYDHEFAARTLKDQATQYRELLARQRDRDFCRREANNMMGLFDRLDALDSYGEKQKIMAFFEDMALPTYVVSYLGQFILGENAAHINSIHLYNSGTAGLGINMIACGDRFVLDFKQSFPSDKYAKAFVREAEALGIDCEISEAVAFETPGDFIVRHPEE